MSSADRGEPIGTSANWRRVWFRRYGLVGVAVTLATLANRGLDVELGFSHFFSIYYPAILTVALLGGFWSGLGATVFSAWAAEYFLLAPSYSAAVSHPSDRIALALFVVVGLAISGVADSMRQRVSKLREFERVTEGLQEMVAVVDRNYRYLVANRAFLYSRGMKPEEVIGQRVSEVLNPGVFESVVKQKIDECFQGKTVQYEMNYTYPARGERELMVTYFPIEGPEGIDRVASVLRDVTDIKKADRSLRLFRTLMDQSNDAVQVVDVETLHILDVNEKACKDLGYTREELLSMTVFDINPEVDEAMHSQVTAILRERGSTVFEGVRRRKDGSMFPVELSLRLAEPDRKYVVAVSREITERKNAEAALRASEDRYRDLVEHSEDLVCTHDLEGRLLSVNPAPARALGYEVPDLLKMPMRDLIAPEFREQFDAYLSRIRTRGFDKGLLCVVTGQGERRIWRYNNTLRTEGVAAPIVRGMAHDVTERRRAEAALRNSETRYRTLFEKAVAGVGILRLDGVVIDCNDTWAHIFRHRDASECRGRQIMECYADPAEREELLNELKRGGVVTNRELELRTKDGTPLWVLLNSALLDDGSGEPLIQSTVFDITASRLAENALRKSEEHFRILVEQACDGIFLADGQGRYLDVNTAGVEMLGYTREEILQLSIADIIAAEEVPRIAPEVARFDGGAIARSEWKFRRKDGSFFPGEVVGRRLPDGRLQGVLRDMTERNRAEELIRQSEQRFRVALRGSPIAVFTQDRDLRYTWIYNSAHFSKEEVVGKTDDEILGRNKANRLRELKLQVLKTGVGVREEVVVPHNGTSFAYDMTIEPLLDSGNNIVGITGAAADIARLREMTDRLQEATERLAREKSYLESQIQTELGFEEIIGQSPALREVLKKARIVAPTDSTVLLLGETGTGKELVARSVHALSARSEQNFVKLNCAAVPSGLLESELFGHEKGAFTGAVSKKIGRIELADKGTLFLDEIGELPPELQPKLLRVLQDREFERLGGVQTLRVDVRIISATNRDLRRDVEDKKFREDLFYRLNVFPIELPPLRERRDDIPMLVRHFVAKHAKRMGKQIETIPEEVVEVLRNWSWPGNIRELENLVERMVIMSKGRTLAPPPAELQDAEGLTEDNLTEMEREHIIRILRETNGVLSGDDGAASRLGIKRTTLQSMMKRLGIEPQEYRRANGTFGRQ